MNKKKISAIGFVAALILMSCSMTTVAENGLSIFASKTPTVTITPTYTPSPTPDPEVVAFAEAYDQYQIVRQSMDLDWENRTNYADQVAVLNEKLAEVEQIVQASDEEMKYEIYYPKTDTLDKAKNILQIFSITGLYTAEKSLCNSANNALLNADDSPYIQYMRLSQSKECLLFAYEHYLIAQRITRRTYLSDASLAVSLENNGLPTYKVAYNDAVETIDPIWEKVYQVQVQKSSGK